MLTYHLIKARSFHSTTEVTADEISFFIPQHPKANYNKTAYRAIIHINLYLPTNHAIWKLMCKSNITHCKRLLTTLMPMTDQHLISPNDITPKSNFRATRIIRKWSPMKETLDCWTNSPSQPLRECTENRMENMHINVEDLKAFISYGYIRIVWMHCMGLVSTEKKWLRYCFFKTCSCST